MPVPIVRVLSSWMPYQDGDSCCFCGTASAYVYYPLWMHLCKDCARKHDVDEVVRIFNAGETGSNQNI
jgi:NMD protein affecting ribosome stability and mRNA decay